jgi:5-methyltetrahydrofolate--homocysteine methyltransferase
MILDLMNERPVLLDSAMGTALIAAGALPAGAGSETANLNAPGVVEDIHRRNIEAGCDIVTANTFGAHIGAGLRESDDPKLTEDALRAGMRLARRAADGAADGRKVYVALDIGPIGDIIGLTSSLTHDDARGIFARMAGIGASEGADLILIETMSDLAEAVDAIAASKAETDLPVFCSMTFGENGRTFMGVSTGDFAAAAAEAGADVIGCNCSLGPGGMLPVARALIDAAGDIRVMAEPNAGPPLMDGDRVYYDVTPGEFSDGAYKMVEAGVRACGGCCGTTPEMIALLKRRIG